MIDLISVLAVSLAIDLVNDLVIDLVLVPIVQS